MSQPANMSSSRSKRADLMQYYDSSRQVSPSLDLNSTKFDAKKYSDKLIKECSLKQLLEEESKLASSAHSLDSDCQTLVYEHYDKFLHATDLVHKLKEGSSEMEDQLQQLETNMAQITESSFAITSGLKERREELSKLLEVHNTLNKLEFLYQLPTRMEHFIAEGNMSEAVDCYLSTKDLLRRYQHLSSLSAVQSDCENALVKLKDALHATIAQGSSKELATCVELLLQLGEPKVILQDSFLKQAQQKLTDDLKHLKSLALPISVQSSIFPPEKDFNSSNEDITMDSFQETSPQQKFSHDLLEFIDECHDGHGASLWLLISSYQEMFLSGGDRGPGHREAASKLQKLVETSVKDFLSVVDLRLREEIKLSPLHTSVMSTALDKLHRRLKALETMMQQSYYTQWSVELILQATELQCKEALEALNITLENTLGDVRQGIASGGGAVELPSLLSHLVASTAASIKHNLGLLVVFLSPQCSFSAEETFRIPFIMKQAREGTIVEFLKNLSDTLGQFSGASTTSPNNGSGGKNNGPSSPSLLLVLARAAWDLHTSTAHYLLRECDEALGVLKIRAEGESELTASEVVTGQLRNAAQKLLDAYVRKQGAALAQLLVRSVELKDWLTCGEPRSVRRVMRTVREDLETSERQVGVLYEEGARKERSSDSSRRTYHSTSIAGPQGPSHKRTHSNSTFSTSGARLNLSKLWCDRIEIFAPVSPNKLSIMTGIVKIALKSLEECIRLRTLSKFGLQQVQVDVHYLRTHLWRHVSDDSLLNVLLDEVITGAAIRCNEPHMMEHSVVEFICEQ